MDKTTTFSKQRFRRSFFAFGRTTAPSNNSEIGLWRSFFASGRTTAPTGTGRISSFGGRSSGLGERPPQSTLLDLVLGDRSARSGRTTGDRSVSLLCWAKLGGRPARVGRTTADHFDELEFCLFWAVARPNLGERPALVLLVDFILASKSLVFVLLHLDFRASYQLICTLKKLVKNT